MNILACVMLGAILGALGASIMGFNEGRGRLMCAAIGAFGGFIGGKIIAPMFMAPLVAGQTFSFGVIGFAMLVAAVFLVAGDWIGKRWDV